MTILDIFLKVLMWLYSRIWEGRKHSVPPPTLDPFDPSTPLLRLSPEDLWGIDHSFQGTFVTGRSGGGKTSGPGATIIKAFMRNGYGGIFLTTKPDDCEMYKNYAKETGREEDVRIISPDNSEKFNFLNYELTRSGKGAGQTENILNLFKFVLKIVEGDVTPTGDGVFFDRGKDEMLRSTIDLLSIAIGRITLEDISNLINSAPQSRDDVTDKETSYSWWKHSYCAKCLTEAESKVASAREAHDIKIVSDYWLSTFAGMADKTRSSIVVTYTSLADCLLHGFVHELLCTETTITPEASWQDGALIIVDLPPQEYGEAGRIVQGVWKYMWQKAVLRRDVTIYPRPVCLVVDEAQMHLNSYDWYFQTVARSARVATLYMTQGVPSFYAVLGNNGEHQTNSLLTNLATKIFCANSDPTTNNYAVDVISKERSMLFNYGTGERGGTGGGSEAILDKILPSDFVTLRTGGVSNNREVDAIVFMSGRTWKATGDTYMKAVFRQR